MPAFVKYIACLAFHLQYYVAKNSLEGSFVECFYISHQEYIMVALFVIAFVVVLLVADLIIQTRKKQYPIAAAQPSAALAAGDRIRVPKGVFFHPGHTWARMLSGEKLEIGIDDFIQKSLGKIDTLNLPAIGTKVKQGEPVVSIQHAGRTLRMVAPVSGTIMSVNDMAVDNPALIHDNPYKEGWLFTIEPENLAQNLSPLAIAENAVDWIKNEIVRFRDFVTARTAEPALVGETMLDGGITVDGALDHLSEKDLASFEEEFLR